MATYQTNHISLILRKKMEALCTTYNLFYDKIFATTVYES